MFNKKSEQTTNNIDSLPIPLLVIFVGIIIITMVQIVFKIIAPTIITSVIGGYILYWAWHSKDERRITRTAVTFLSFGFLISAFWYMMVFSFSSEYSSLGNYLNKEVKTAADFFQVIAQPFLIGIPLVASIALAVFFHNKWQPPEEPYRRFKNLALFLTKPASLGTKVYNGIPKKGPLSYVVGILGSVFVVLFVPLFIEAVGLAVKLPHLGKLLGSSYLILGMYSIFSHSKKANAFAERLTANFVKSEGVFIGNIVAPERRTLRLTWNDINHHIHILGQPGSGKSVLLRNFYAHQIQSGEGLMVIDLKADLDVQAEIQGLVHSVNRESDLVVIDLSNPGKSMGYNPLLRGGASELKDKIMSSLDWSEQYYKKTAEEFLLKIFNGLVPARDANSLTPTLIDVYECLTYPESLDALAEKLSSKYNSEKNDLRELANRLKDKKTFSDLVGIRTDIEVMLKSSFGQILTRPEGIDVLEAIKTKKVILVELDGQTFRDTAVRFGRMLISDLRSASGAIASTTYKGERPRFTVIVDEFADIVSNEEMGKGFAAFLNRSRGSGIGFIVAHQSLGDFINEQTQKQILDSTETLISFVQKHPENCETLAGIAGTKDAISITEQTENFFFMTGKTGRGTQKLTQEYIFHPNEFKNLNVGEAIYIAKKTSRNGKLQVKSIEVPRLQKDLEDQSWRDRDSNLQSRMLNLKDSRISKRSLATLAEPKGYEGRLLKATEADI